MSAQRRGVGHHAIVADDAIVGDMRISHDQIIAADDGLTAAVESSRIDGDVFTDDVVFSNIQENIVIVGKLFILGRAADDRAGIDLAIAAYRRLPGDNAMAADTHVIPKGQAAFNDRIRPHAYSGGDLGVPMDDRCFMNINIFHMFVYYTLLQFRSNR